MYVCTVSLSTSQATCGYPQGTVTYVRSTEFGLL